MNSLRLLLFALALGVLAALSWRFVAPSPRDALREPSRTAVPAAPASKVTAARVQPPPAAPVASTTADARRSVEARLTEAPQYAAVFAALGGTFPHVQESLLDQWSARLVRSGVLASPDSLVWQAMRDVQQSQGLLARRADDQALTAYFDARLALLDAMAPGDPKLCADFLYGNTDVSLDAFSATHRDLVANLAERELAALKSGQDGKGDPVAPTPADFDLVVAGLTAKGLSQDEIGMLLDGRMLDPPPSDTRLCDMGRTYLTVLRALPAEARLRIYGLAAELLARS